MCTILTYMCFQDIDIIEFIAIYIHSQFQKIYLYRYKALRKDETTELI